MAKDLYNNDYYVIPGQKLCPKCRLTYSKSKTDIDQIETNDSESDNMITYDKEIYLNTTKESLNNTLFRDSFELNELDISPVKVHSVVTHSKLALGKRKLKQVKDVITEKLVSVLMVDQTELTEEYVQNNIAVETQSKANDLDYLVDCMKDKFKISNRRKRLQILTLVLNSWSLRKTAEVFLVSKSTIQKARLLRDEKGITEYPDLLKQQKLTDETKKFLKFLL